MLVNFKRLSEVAQAPKFQNEGDVCADLTSVNDYTIPPRSHAVIPTGIAIGLEAGWEAQIRPRSGLAAKHGISIVNAPGTIDSGYRGEIKIILRNNSDTEFEIHIGDRIAQIAIRPVPEIEFLEVEELDDTQRGENGFGSTGIRSIEQKIKNSY